MHTGSESILSISPGIDKTWDVKDSGGRKPLASFNNAQDACAWAIKLAQSRQARVVVEHLITEIRSPALTNTSAPIVQFSIPVTCEDAKDGRLRESAR